MRSVITREAFQHEIPKVVDLAVRFFNESEQSKSGALTVRPEGYRQLYARNWRHPHFACFVAVDVDTQEFLGFVTIYAHNDYTVELMGEMLHFYVLPDARGTGVARALAAAASARFDSWCVAKSYVEAAPEIPDLKALQTFANLWGKYGFRQAGIILTKE